MTGGLDDRDEDEERRVSEESPLLSQSVPDEPGYLYRQNVTLLCYAAIFLAQLGFGMMQPAWNNRMEDIICEGYLPQLDVGGPPFHGGDPRCRDPAVQGKLAMLRGWQTTVECIPAILCAIPYGIMADKKGRKPVLYLAYVGLLLMVLWVDIVLLFKDVFPLWTILISPVFTFIGGFSSVGPALIYTVLADVTPQAERASVYLRLHAALLVAELLANPLGGALLELSVWLPLGVGFIIAIISAITLVFMPETLDLIKQADEREGLVPNDEAGEDDDEKESILRKAIRIIRENAADTWKFVLGNKRVVLLMMPMVFYIIGRLVQELLMQYARARYGWSWSKAAYLLTIRTTSNLVLNLVLLPALSTILMQRFGMSPLVKDLFLARASGITVAIGLLLIGLAYTPWILSFALIVFALGSGFNAVLRSLLNSFVESHHQAILNSLLGLLEYVGIMIASPLLFAALDKGNQLGGIWMGLPFFAATLALAAATAIVFVFRLPPGSQSTST